MSYRILFFNGLLSILPLFAAQASFAFAELTVDQRSQLDRANAIQDRDRLGAMARAGNCYAYLTLAVNHKREDWSSRDLVYAYDCGLKNFGRHTDFPYWDFEEHPLGFEPKSRTLRYSLEARELLERALSEGSFSAAIELATWEIDGVSAAPDLAKANQYLVTAAQITLGPPTSWLRKRRVEGPGWTAEPWDQSWRLAAPLLSMLEASKEVPDSEFWFNYVETKIVGSMNYDLLGASEQVSRIRTLLIEANPSLNPRATPPFEVVFVGFLMVFAVAIFVFKRRNKVLATASATTASTSYRVKEAATKTGDLAGVAQERVAEIDLVAKAFASAKPRFGPGPKYFRILCLAFFVSLGVNLGLPSIEMTVAALAISSGLAQTISGGLFGYLIKLLFERFDGTTPAAIGRKWSGWAIFLAAMSEASFFGTLELNDLARLVVAIIGVGGIAFVLGWAWTKVRGT